MALNLIDKWVWDFWFAQDGPDYHIFYLQAPRALRDEPLRHWHVSIGHAVSRDLRHWQILSDALVPSVENEDAFDNYTTWTGSSLRSRSSGRKVGLAVPSRSRANEMGRGPFLGRTSAYFNFTP